MKRFGLVVLAAAVIAAVVWGLLERRTPAPETAPTAVTGTGTPPELERVAIERATTPHEPSTERQAAPEATPASVTLRGRCVDDQAVPLAGCTVKLRGRAANQARTDAYLADHDTIDWQDPDPQTTGTDGRFVFTFAPLPPLRFYLDITTDNRLRLTGDWNELVPGTTKDLGDIVMRSGCRVSGEVVDTEGRPIEGAELTADQLNRGQSREIHARQFSQGVSDAAGRFTLRDLVSAGNWNLKISGAGTFARQTLEVPEDTPTHFVRIEIERRDPTARPRISGVVVDETGAPVVQATVRPADGIAFYGNVTNASGAFVLEARDGGGGEPARLQLRCDGYQPLDPADTFAWGSTDLRFVMQRGPALEVQVVDAATDLPIEDYSLRAFHKPGTTNTISSDDFTVRTRGHHPDGKAELRLTPGTYVLVVEPRGETRLDAFHECTITAAPSQRQVVRVQPPGRRTLVVRNGAGEPIAGTRAELLAPLSGEPIDLATFAFDLARGGVTSSTNQARLLMKGTTDARGELPLAGPPDVALSLRLLGPGHTPLVVGDVHLDRPEPLLVTVPAGATLRGRLRPALLLEQLRASGGNFRPGLSLTREVGGVAQRYPVNTFERFEFDDGGAFRIEGIAAGTWELQLCWATPNAFGVQPQSRPVDTLRDLRDGEERTLDLLLDHLVHGTLRGQVLVAGQPFAGHAQLETAGEQPNRFQRMVTTDSSGRFEATVQEGEYRISVTRLDQTSGAVSNLRSSTTVFVPRNQSIDTVFEVPAGALRLTLVRADGTPIEGIRVMLLLEDEETWQSLPATDAQGRTELASAPVGRLRARVLPNELVDAAAMQAFLAANKGDPQAWERALVTIGTVTVTDQREPEPQTLIVPASAGY